MISLSNLVKPQYYLNIGSEKVIINADERFLNSKKGSVVTPLNEESMGQDVQMQEISEDSFMSGIAAEEVQLEPQPSAEEILEEAHAEAEMILSGARAEAERIQEEAKQQVELLFERKKQEAYKEGVSKLQDELIERSEQMKAEYQEKEQQLQAEYDQKLETMESDLVDVMIRVFNKVFHIQFDNKKQILLHLIKDTLLGIDAGKEFTIRVGDANFKFIESHIADIKEKIGNDVSIDVVNDMTLDDESCLIENATGIYNCGMDMVLANIEKDIRSLCG